MIPVTGLVPLAHVEFLTEKVRQLERELDATLGLLKIMAERMQQTLGVEALGPELRRLLTEFDADGQQEIVARLDDLADSGAEPEAARLIRSLSGDTWDHALSTSASWRNFSKDDKARWARGVLLQKAIRPKVSAEESS
jgi:hypothetical protein